MGYGWSPPITHFLCNEYDLASAALLLEIDHNFSVVKAFPKIIRRYLAVKYVDLKFHFNSTIKMPKDSGHFHISLKFNLVDI